MGKGLSDGRRYDPQRAIDFLMEHIQAGRATAMTLAVYCAIRKFCRHPPGHEDFMRCWPSVEALAETVSKRRKLDGEPPDPRTVKREIQRLQVVDRKGNPRLGLIYRRRRRRDSAYTCLVADPYHTLNVRRQHGCAAAVRENESWRCLMATPEHPQVRRATSAPSSRSPENQEGPTGSVKKGQILQGPPVPPEVVEVVVQGLEVGEEKAVGPPTFSPNESAKGNGNNPTPTVQEVDMSQQIVAVVRRPMTAKEEEERRRFLKRQCEEMMAEEEGKKADAEMRRVAAAMLCA